MKTIVIIPARSGSVRLPNKNSLSLGGVSLIVHSILYAQKNSAFIDEIYVSTNDEAIKKIALQYGVKVIVRPESLSGDFEPTVTALQHVLKFLDFEVENVVLLQPTSPLREEKLLKDAFDVYQKGNHNSLFTVSRNHHKVGKIDNNRFIPFNYEIGQRSQDLEPLYYENGLLYISKGKLILEGKIVSESAYPYEINHVFATVDIDTQEDLDYAEYLIKKNEK